MAADDTPLSWWLPVRPAARTFETSCGNLLDRAALAAAAGASYTDDGGLLAARERDASVTAKLGVLPAGSHPTGANPGDLIVALAHTGFEIDLEDGSATGTDHEDFGWRLSKVPGNRVQGRVFGVNPHLQHFRIRAPGKTAARCRPDGPFLREHQGHLPGAGRFLGHPAFGKGLEAAVDLLGGIALLGAADPFQVPPV